MATNHGHRDGAAAEEALGDGLVRRRHLPINQSISQSTAAREEAIQEEKESLTRVGRFRSLGDFLDKVEQKKTMKAVIAEIQRI